MYQRTETEIMKNWQGDKSIPLVSICTITYNHEQFIGNALDSFLMQETDFPFEIVIDDDYSTDKNAKIIQNYVEKYPNICKAHLRSVNVGIAINFSENLKRSQGKYIALCEGDDYWTDKDKLKIQVNILKKYKGIDLCFHKAIKIDMRNQNNLDIGGYLDNDGIIPIEDILLKSKGQIPTASIIFKKSILEGFIAFFTQGYKYTVGDIFIHFFGSKRGGAYFINQSMSIYRYSSEGSWSAMQKDSNHTQKIENSDSRINAYEKLDAFERHLFSKAFHTANKKRALVIIKDPDIPWFPKVSFIFKHRKYFMFNEQLVYLASAVIPITSYIPNNVYQYLKKLFKMPSRKI